MLKMCRERFFWHFLEISLGTIIVCSQCRYVQNGEVLYTSFCFVASVVLFLANGHLIVVRRWSNYFIKIDHFCKCSIFFVSNFLLPSKMIVMTC